MRPIIVGSGGFIGAHLVRALSPLIYTHYKDAPYLLDLKKPSINSLPITNQSHVIIAAGCANVNYCTKHSEESYAINVEGTLELSKQCINRGLFPILFSTDYVFDGKTGGYSETSPTCPINSYGKQKEELEKRIDAVTNGNHLMLRLSKIYATDKGDSTLIDEMIQNLLKGEVIRAATDQIFCPLHIKDLIFILKTLVMQKEKGLFNVGTKETLSRYDLALKVARAINVSENNVKPISLDDLGGGPRPKKTALTSDKLYNTVGIDPETIDTSIAALTSCYLSRTATFS